MNWLDIGIIISLAISGVIGWRFGIIKVIAGMVGIVLGIFLAGQLGESVGSAMTFIDSANLATFAGYGTVFLAVFVGAMVLASVLRKFLSMVFLGWVDSAAGAALGIAAGGLIWSGIVTAMASFPFGGVADTIQDSELAVFVADTVPIALAFLPGDYVGVSSLLEDVPGIGGGGSLDSTQR